MRIEHYEKTDVGKKRAENQDTYGLSEGDKFFVVCDGMGGGAAGDFASQLAVEVVLKSFKLLNPNEIKMILGDTVAGSEEILRPLAAIRLANRALKNYSEKFPGLSGMGTTVAAALFDQHSRTAHIYNVGDSRVYRVRSGRITQLTKDHTKVSELVESGKMRPEEVKNAEIQSMLTRALGTEGKVRIDYRPDYFRPNDCYIICTDGVNGELDDSVIRDIASINKDSAESITKELIFATNNAGGRDNSTVITVRILDGEGRKAQGAESNYESVVTVNEETLEQSSAEDRILRKILPKTKMRVPDAAKEKNIFSNPILSGAMAAFVLLGAVVFFVNFSKTSYDRGLTELAGKVSGIKLDVRSPVKDQIDRFLRSDDNVIKLRLIQDWNKDTATTEAVGDALISVKAQGKDEFSGISGLSPAEIDLPGGDHEIGIKYPGYKIITDKMELKDSIEISVESGDSLRPVTLIIVPEKIRKGEKSGFKRR